jgi:tetratricopeptide (TPR) repeat protein
MSKQNKNQSDPEQSVGRTLSSVEQFLEKNKNSLFYALGALALAAMLYFGYFKLYKEPLHEEALGQMYTAEQYFRVDSFALALNGDGNAYGFLQIADEYGSNAGPIVNFYIGSCQLQLGQYREAIASFGKYSGSDEVTPALALACIGDAYVGLGEWAPAYEHFIKAARYRDNAFAARYLLKAALVSEEMGNRDDALKLYEQIRIDYSQTTEGREIDKYIARLNAAL